jgi:hypothetical protein
MTKSWSQIDAQSEVAAVLRKLAEYCPKVRGIPQKSHGFGIPCQKPCSLVVVGGVLFAQVDT